MPKLVQIKDTEVLIAMSFWALGHPMTCMIGFVLSGLKAAGDNEKLLSVSTTIVDGLAYGPANLLLTCVTCVMNLMCYVYIRYALRLQLQEIPSLFTWLYFISYVGLVFLLAFPPIKVHISPFDYGVQYLGSQIFMIFSILWIGYFSQWLKTTGGRACLIVALCFAGVLLFVSWTLAAAVGEKNAAPVEWCSMGIIMACYAIIVFMCEREKFMKLNSNGFSVEKSATPQEYDQL